MPEFRLLIPLSDHTASDPRLAVLPIGLGAKALSARPATVPDAEVAIRTLDSEICGTLAEAALAADGADDVRKILETIRS